MAVNMLMPCKSDYYILESTKCVKDGRSATECKLVGVANNSQLGTDERVREKVKKFIEREAKGQEMSNQ